jgi:hypothetical protein
LRIERSIIGRRLMDIDIAIGRELSSRLDGE